MLPIEGLSLKREKKRGLTPLCDLPRQEPLVV